MELQELTKFKFVHPVLKPAGWTFALAWLLAGHAWSADPPPVPVFHVTDLFRPHNDPDDHWDLASHYSLALQGKVDLRGVMMDHPKPEWLKEPDIAAVAQLNHLTGKAVPVVVGSSQPFPGEPERNAASAPALAGVRAFLDLMRESPRPVFIHVLGSCRDVALAARLEPELFSRHCAGVYLNAGSGTPDPVKARQLEYNVALDPANYAALFALPCPLYWLPCFETVSRDPKEMWRVAPYGSFYRFRQSDILPLLSQRMQNYFLAMYAGGRTANGLWLQQLSSPPDSAALAAEGNRDRNMWCTAGFLHAAGLTVTTKGEILPLASTTDPAFTFEPVQATCSPEGVTHWIPGPSSPPRFLFTVRDVNGYQAAMTAALKSLLTNLP